MNKITITLLLLLAAGGCRNDTAEPARETKLAEEVKRLAAEADWWEHQYFDMQSLSGLQPASRPADDKRRTTEEGVTRIVAGVDGGGPRAVASLEALAASEDVNLRCWALEILGRCGNRSSLELLKKSAKDGNWRSRAAAILAIGRTAAVGHDIDLLRFISDGMDDSEPVYTRKDSRGEFSTTPRPGGGEDYYLPVVLSSLRAAVMLSDAAGIEVVLKGLHTRPFVSLQFDTTPEPFPDIVTAWLPSWYVIEASQICRALGPQAVQPLLDLAGQPEHEFCVSGGGRHKVSGIPPIVAILNSMTQFNSTHHFAVGHLENLVGKGPATYLLVALRKSRPDKSVNVLHAISFKADDEALGEIVHLADDALFLQAISQSVGGPLKKGINTKLIVERLISLLKAQENEAGAYQVPAILAGIDDDRVRAALVAVVTIGDGDGSLMAEHRGVGAITALGRIGTRDTLTFLKNLKTVGDMSAGEPWIKAAIDQAILELETRLCGAKE